MIKKNVNDYLKQYLAFLPAFQAIFRSIEAEALSHYSLKEPILDFGCGDGIFSSLLFNRPRQIVGLDINNNALKEAGKKGLYQKLINYDGRQLPFKENEFQTVVANSVLEHVEDLRPLLKEVCRVLKKCGILVLTAPSNKRKQYYLIYRLFVRLGMKKRASLLADKMNNTFNHHHCFSGKNWTKELIISGFSQVEYVYKASPKTALISDCLLLLAPIAMLEKRIFGRYLGWRKYLLKIFGPFLPEFKDKVKGNNGVVIVIKAVK